MFRTLNKHKQCLPRKTWLIGFFLCLLYIVILPTCSKPLPKVHILTEIDENPLEKYSQECREAHRRSNYSSALKICNDGLRLSKSAGERKYEGEFATYIGLVYDRIGHYEKALTFLEQSLAIARELDDRDEEGTDLNNISSVYNSMGRYDKALIYLEQALAISREIGDRTGEAAALGNIGAVYWGLGQYNKAFSYSEQALAIAREVDNRSSEGAFLGNIAAIYWHQGEYDKALSYLKKALIIDRETVDRARDGSILGNIGSVYFSMDRYDKALLSFEQALAIFREIGNKAAEGSHLTNIGSVYRSLEQYEKALTYYERALVVSNAVEAPETMWRVFFGLMQCQKALNNQLIAIFFGKQSVNMLQSMRLHIGGLEDSLQQSFIEDKRIVYELLADLLVDEGRLTEAQQVLAMLKEEEYFDFIRRRSEKDPRGTQISFTRKEKHWENCYNKISDRLVTIALEHRELLSRQKIGLTAEEESRLADLEQELDVALKAFYEYLVEIKRNFRETKRVQQREFPEKELESLRAFQSTLEQLGGGTVAIHYLSTSDRLRIIVTSGNASLPPFHRDAKIGEKRLNHLIFNYRHTLQNPIKNPLPQAKQLYDFILKPIEADLIEMGAKILLVYLDGTLRYLPLSALHDGNHYIAERFAVVMYTIAAKDKLKEHPGGAWQAAGLGVSEAAAGFVALTAVPDELDGIIKESVEDPVGVIPGIVYLNKEFTEQSLSSVLREGYPVVHLASHFHFAPGTEVDSFLLLGAGQRLSLEQFVSVKYPLGKLDLLTLSACETGLGGGEKKDGSEVEGFGVLAQRQGAKAVLATLWKVADRSTGQFMQELYRLREEENLTKAKALQEAQKKFIHGKTQITVLKQTQNYRAVESTDDTEGEYRADPMAPYAHPYYWAPFILMGNYL